MMRKTMVRTMTTSTVNAYAIKIVDGAPTVETLEPLVVTGKVSEKEATKLLVKKYGKGVTVGKIETEDCVYEMSIDDFMKYATKKVNGVAVDDKAKDEQATAGTDKAGDEKKPTEPNKKLVVSLGGKKNK